MIRFGRFVSLTLSLLLASIAITVEAYNLDTDEPMVRQGFNGEGALFGYSVAQLKDSAGHW